MTSQVNGRSRPVTKRAQLAFPLIFNAETSRSKPTKLVYHASLDPSQSVVCPQTLVNLWSVPRPQSVCSLTPGPSWVAEADRCAWAAASSWSRETLGNRRLSTRS